MAISKKRNLLLYLVLTSLVVLANYSLYHFPIYKTIPDGAVLGSILDFLIVIPLLTYFLIIRKRYSLKYLGVVILAGYGAAYLIIPNAEMEQYSFLPYIILGSEGLLILLELYILYKVVTKLPKLIKEYKKLSLENSFFLYNLRLALDKYLPNQKVLQIFLSEFAVFYYSLFSWKKKVKVSHGTPFTYHKKTSSTAVYIMLIHATIIESVGLHYLLHQWNEIVAYILLFLNVYGVLYFLGEIHATRLTPFLLTDKQLYLQTGLAKSMDLPLQQIKEFKYYDGPEKFTRKELDTLFDARVADFISEKPTFEILLNEPQTMNLMYGIERKVDRIVLNVDEPNQFYEELNKRLVQKNID
ncbi:hypothetical protein ACFYKX_02555 [Cytobacillus sp. FJAT-54145]|uniref:Beta-carotene 15,15'-monooxygenase n=1 Tax=Cytobacillus spartinae TaxID=3299023 RepID=A0ABW6K5Q4_9BACI